MNQLPELNLGELRATRDYLQDASKVLGKLQQAFLPAEPHGWQYGLEVTMRGISTQVFEVNRQPTRASLDLVRHKLRLGERNWKLLENAPAQLFAEVKAWLTEQGIDAKLDEPEFSAGELEYDNDQADAYAAAVWWLEEQFRALKDSLHEGVASPILLYPHHFDLSLAWFPHNDERQLAVGFSTGDETIKEPYIYLTAYPEPTGFTSVKLPSEAYWQTGGFSGGILPYAALQKSANPRKLFQEFTKSFK